ncbi:hypothetical protein [Maribacter arcticus]|uniref:Uncharacterized protein n=1 Tax=Maribacter arcticus TaxID=561365 RepID=A0A1T5EVV9_9FLAO|nr:hypothetical protein [Maribacter arcticus]SKB88095.1 hypothetical protein SAMN05660866_03741 [Maribacter arcticus]
MRNLTIILVLILCFSCKTDEKDEFFEIELTEKTVVGIWPDSVQISEMKKEYGEDDFYTVADDIIWYNGKMHEVIDSLKINYIHTDKRKVRIITPKDRIEINNDTSETKWRYIYYNGKETLEKDVFEIIDLYKFYE